MTEERLTQLLTRAVDQAVQPVRVPPAPVVPLRRRASRLAPLAAAAAVAACVALTVTLPGPSPQARPDVAATAAASGPATPPPGRQEFDAAQEALCPGAFASDRSDTPDGLPYYDRTEFAVRSGELITIDWSSHRKGSEVSLVRVDVQPPVVLERSSATAAQGEFTVRPEGSMRLELQGTSPSGYLCPVTEYRVKVDGQPLSRSYSTRSLPLLSMRMEALEGRRLTVTGEITHHTDQTVSLYLIEGYETPSEDPTYTRLGDIALQPDGTFRAEHEFAAPGEYRVAARTNMTATHGSHQSGHVHVNVQ